MITLFNGQKERRGSNMLMTMTMKIMRMIVILIMTTNDQSLQTQVVSESVDYLLSHFQQPLFPRKIMTKHLGYQIEVIVSMNY